VASPQQAIFANQTSRHFSRGPETLLPVRRFVRALDFGVQNGGFFCFAFIICEFFIHGGDLA
jgi:hypothetical protein